MLLHSEWQFSGPAPYSAGPEISAAGYKTRFQQLNLGLVLKLQPQLQPSSRHEQGPYHNVVPLTLRMSTVTIDNSTPSSSIRRLPRFSHLVIFISVPREPYMSLLKVERLKVVEKEEGVDH